jgi:sterol desaturase/sphingolipid hydroxylase (fatty acid hydroxylase superfamily)
VHEITTPSWHNYFYGLIVISLFFFILEQVKPWHQKQPRIRKDFWLDGFYMFFNFFIFSLVLYNAVADVASQVFNDFLSLFGLSNWAAISAASMPKWVQLPVLFLARDFVQWNIHRLLHRRDFLWQFHQVHHSVKQMGFAAHLRYHWMETVVYRTLEYIPLGIIGFGIRDFFVVHIFALFIGHFNHSNFKFPLGPLKYFFNNPRMHIWHHVKDLPPGHSYGCNFGLSLSLWDYLFKTAYIPKSGQDIELGFPGDEKFPKRFFPQVLYPLTKKDRR